MAALTVARLTLLELWRRRLVPALAVLLLVLVALAAWTFSHLAGLAFRFSTFFGVETQPVASQLLILVMFLWSALFAISAAFVAAPAISASVESGEILAILARPVHRAEFVLGRWLGLALFVAAFATVGSAAQIGVTLATTGHAPVDTQGTILSVVLEGLVVLTLSLALSTRLSAIAAGVVALASFGLAWLGGVVGGIGAWTHTEALADASTVTKLLLPSDAVWRVALYHLERPGGIFSGARSVTMAANPPFSLNNETAGGEEYLLWSAGWIVVVLLIAIVSFRTREL